MVSWGFHKTLKTDIGEEFLGKVDFITLGNILCVEEIWDSCGRRHSSVAFRRFPPQQCQTLFSYYHLNWEALIYKKSWSRSRGKLKSLTWLDLKFVLSSHLSIQQPGHTSHILFEKGIVPGLESASVIWKTVGHPSHVRYRLLHNVKIQREGKDDYSEYLIAKRIITNVGLMWFEWCYCAIEVAISEDPLRIFADQSHRSANLSVMIAMINITCVLYM